MRECASGYLQALATWMRSGAQLPPAECSLGPLNDASTAVQSDIAKVILESAND